MTESVAQQIFLTKRGLSVRQVAFALGINPTTVTHTRHRYGVGPHPFGVDVEDKLEKWLTENDINFKRSTRGDSPYDFSIENKRVDLKSSHLTKDGKTYFFSLSDTKNRKLPKNIHKQLDEFWFVFLDIPHQPILRCNTKFFYSYQQGVRLNRTLKSRYPLELVGYLT